MYRIWQETTGKQCQPRSKVRNNGGAVKDAVLRFHVLVSMITVVMRFGFGFYNGYFGVVQMEYQKYISQPLRVVIILVGIIANLRSVQGLAGH